MGRSGARPRSVGQLEYSLPSVARLPLAVLPVATLPVRPSPRSLWAPPPIAPPLRPRFASSSRCRASSIRGPAKDCPLRGHTLASLGRTRSALRAVLTPLTRAGLALATLARSPAPVTPSGFALREPARPVARAPPPGSASALHGLRPGIARAYPTGSQGHPPKRRCVQPCRLPARAWRLALRATPRAAYGHPTGTPYAQHATARASPLRIATPVLRGLTATSHRLRVRPIGLRPPSERFERSTSSPAQAILPLDYKSIDKIRPWLTHFGSSAHWIYLYRYLSDLTI